MEATIGFFVIGLFVLAGVLLLLGRSGMKFGQVREIVAELVAAAEQLLPGQSGEEKLSWVIAQADEHGLTKYVTPSLLRMMIEAAVLRLKHSPEATSYIHTVGQDEKTVGHRRPL